MSSGLQVINADGSIAVDTAKWGLIRVVHDEILNNEVDVTIAPVGFNSSLPGHVAHLVGVEGVPYNHYMISYPTATTVRVNGGFANAAMRLLVFVA